MGSVNVIAAKPSVFWLILSLTARGAAPVTSLKLLMEVQIHSNCIPSSFYTSKCARITGDSQSRVSCISHGRAISWFPSASPFHQNAVYRIHYCKDLQTCRCCSFTSCRCHILKHACFKGIYKGFWGCIMSRMFAELAEIKRHVWKSMTMTVEHYAWPIVSISNCDTEHKQHNYYFILLNYDTEMLFCRYYTLKANLITEQCTQGWTHIQIRPLDFCNVKGKTPSLYSLFSLKVSNKLISHLEQNYIKSHQ